MSRQLKRKCEHIQQGFFIPSDNPVSMSLVEKGVASYQIRISGSYFYSCSGTVGNTNYRSFISELESQLNDFGLLYSYAVFFSPWSGSIQIAIDAIPGDGTILVIKNGISKDIMGMSPGTHNHVLIPGFFAGGGSWTGSYCPTYVWRTSNPARSDYKKPYEPAGFFTDGVADSGQTFSIGRVGSQLWSDWKWNFEPINKVRKETPNSLEPWTWQHVLEYGRSQVPFTVHTSSIQEASWSNKEAVYRFKASDSNFMPEVPNPTWQEHITLSVKVKVSGTGSSDGR